MTITDSGVTTTISEIGIEDGELSNVTQTWIKTNRRWRIVEVETNRVIASSNWSDLSVYYDK